MHSGAHTWSFLELEESFRQLTGNAITLFLCKSRITPDYADIKLWARCSGFPCKYCIVCININPDLESFV